MKTEQNNEWMNKEKNELVLNECNIWEIKGSWTSKSYNHEKWTLNLKLTEIIGFNVPLPSAIYNLSILI